MFAKYIVRFDDACSTMDNSKWQKIEDLCDKFDIKPIIAVVPNNKDSKLIKDKIDNNFWDKVRKWQNKGWHIALHGYDHVYISKESGLVPFNHKSEFAGLSLAEQILKIQKGIRIFKKEGIDTNIWVAPSHTFDENTLKALKEHTNIQIVSDGVALFPFKKYGFNWIPQQLWHYRTMPFGIWTCCVHPNEMDDNEYLALENFVSKNHKSFVDVISLKYQSFGLINTLFSKIYWIIRKIK